MNNILNTLLAEASSMNQQQNQLVSPSVGQAKQAVVAEASAKKIAAMSEPVPTAEQQYQTLAASSNGVADNTASQQMTDVRTLSPIGLSDKYGGSRASELLANFNQADGKLLQQQTMERDWSQTAGDLMGGVGLGAVNSIGGISALGLGMVNADAGQAAATKLEDFGNFVRDNQSPALQQRREILAATDKVSKSNSDLQYQRDKSEGQGIEADLARFGRGFMDGVRNALQDPITLSDGIAEGSGSFLALAPVSRAANAAKMLKAAAAKDAAITAGKTVEEAAAIAKGVMAKDGMAIPAAIGAMEAGGSYQGSVAEVSNMSHEQLLAGSPAYAEMIAAGVSPEEARTTVANKSGLMAAAITAPFAIAAGSLVKGFEGNALKMGAGKTAAMNMGKETIEEGSQGITGAIAQNFGIQTFADENKSLSENVGEQGGRGALYGLGTAGVMAAPNVAAGAVKGAAGSALDFVINRADAYLAKNEADSPASINRIVEQSASLVQNAPALTAKMAQTLAPVATDTPEVAAAKTTAMADFPGFIDALNISETELQSRIMQPVLSSIAGAKTRPEAITAILTDLKQEKSSQEYFKKAVALQALLDSTSSAVDKLGGIDDSLLPPNVSKLFQSVMGIGDSLMASPEVRSHLNKATQLLQSDFGKDLLNEMNQTTETAQVVATAAQIAPETINPAVANVVLKMAQDGKLVLSEAQKVSLQSAVDLMETAQAFDEELKSQGVPKLRDIVSFEIKTEDDPKLDTQGTRSALQHAREISRLAIRGDMKGAKAALEAFGNFAQGQSNKVTGINQHYAAGKGAPYVTVQVASFKGGMTDIKMPVGVTPTKEGSINHVKRVTAEARFLANMHNKLNETYNLGVPTLLIVDLDTALDGRTADVVAEFNNGKRGYPQQQSLKPPAVTPPPAAPVVKPKKERKPKAVKEPKPLKISVAIKKASNKKLNDIVATASSESTKHQQAVAELALRAKNTDQSTTGKPNVTQTPEAIQAEQNQAAQATSRATATGTPAVAPVNTSAKVVLPLTGKPAVDANRAKDQIKSDKANKFIGQGSVGSSTEAYATAWGDKANTGTYTKDDVVFVSANGNHPKRKRLLPDFFEIDKAVTAGATLITDTATEPNKGRNNKYNEGEREVATYLSEHGYVEKTPGTWTPAAVSNQAAASVTPTPAVTPAKVDTKNATTVNRYAIEHTDINEPLEVEVITDTSTGITHVQAFKNGKAWGPYRDTTSLRKTYPTDEAMAIGLWGSLDPGPEVDAILISSTSTTNKSTASVVTPPAPVVTPAKVEPVTPSAPVVSKPVQDRLDYLDKANPDLNQVKNIKVWAERQIANSTEAIATTDDLTKVAEIEAARAKLQELLDKVNTLLTPIAVPTVTPPTVPKTVEEAYPNLLGNTGGLTSLAKAFNLRKVLSRFFGSVSPAALVQSILSSTESIKDFFNNTETKRSLTPEISTYYGERVPAMVGELVKVMNKALAVTLKDPYVIKNLDKAIHDKVQFKALNIIEKVSEGKYKYNQELVEAAVLGSLNWFQNSTNTGIVREAVDIATLLGINEDDVSPELLAAFNSGQQLFLWDVVPRMATNITEFWGMKANNDFSQSSTVGIPQAVATEILRAMIEVKLISTEPIQPAGAPYPINVFKLDHEMLGTGYKAYPTFLAEMANSEIIEPVYYGDAVIPAAKTQMNNDGVALTSDQVKAIEHEQKTPFFLNQPMLDLYKQLGLDNLLEIFGGGVLNEADKELFNKTHLETVEGKNISILSAFESLLGRAEEMQNIADASGVPLNKLGARFAYGISRVGRMQMLGKQNPQASKLVREALMPNTATIDLNKTEDYNNYMLAVAQMLGIKVHTMPIENVFDDLGNLVAEGSITAAKKLLDGKLKPLVDLMLKFHETNSLDKDAAELIKKLLPQADNTFMGLHAIVDYARTQADGFDRSDYTTNVYVEADGVTNGPVNAMVNLSAGRFNLNWLQNIAKGGLFLTPNQTMNQHRMVDKVDLYQKSTQQFDIERLALKAKLDKDGVGAQMDILMKLMGTFIKDITVTEGGDVILTRGVAKNPLTITIYGSGERGIANKVTGELLDAVYVKMSEAMQKQANYEKDSTGRGLTFAEAMFGDTATDPDAALAEFRNALVQLSTRIVIFSARKKQHFNVSHSIDPLDAPVRNMTSPIRLGDPQLFKVSGPQLAALQENILTLFVNPLRKGIEHTVGEEVMDTTKMLQIATQVQSLGLQVAFKKAVADAMEKFQYPSTMFLSKNQQNKIMEELIKKFPTVKTKAQEFLIAGTALGNVKAADFSHSLVSTFRLKASVLAPADSGVAGSPFLNIGMGDGLMMQAMSLMKDAIQGTLKIFDGINMPVDKIKEGSLQANTAVAQTWQGNPMRAVANSFKAALGNIEEAMAHAKKIVDAPIDPALTKSQQDTVNAEKAAADAEIKAVERIFVALELPSLDMKKGLAYILSEVEHMANQVEARHLTLQDVAHSIDQMASAAAPYQNQGIDLSGYTPKDQVIELNKIYLVKLAQVQARYKANGIVSTQLKDEKRNSSLAPAILYTYEGMLLEVNKFPEDLRATARQALHSPAMRDYRIYVLNPEEFEIATGIPHIDNTGAVTNGAISIENKTIHLASTSPEVWVHELVHAATYEKVKGVLDGTNKDKVTIAAVERLQALRDQFSVMNSDQTNWTTEQVLAYREATNSMAAALQENGEAAALNEFMAWATTNQELIELGKETKATFRAFEKITRAVVNTIRRIFFGSSPDKLPRDFFNAVRFNTALVATRKQPSPVQEGLDTILRHTSSYGNDARLNQIQSTYLSLMAPLFTGVKTLFKQNVNSIYTTRLTLAVETIFPMSQQEKSTFQTVVGALATEAKINPASVAKAQELYNHVTKQLEVEDFMNNPELQDPVDRYYAQEKYDTIMGKTVLTKDALDRSSLMPVFLALATTNDEFRTILAKMSMPAVVKNKGTTFDVYLRNYGTEAMEALANQLSGVKLTNSVVQAIDGLQNNITANNAEKTTLLGMVSNKMGSWADTANDYVVGKMGATAAAGVALGNKMQQSNIKVVSGAAGIVKVLSGSLSDKTSAFMAEGMLSAMNKQNGLQPLRDFANDMLGRVGSNADIYDMIKQVRSTVAAVRQEFRENVPMKLEKTFKTKITDEVWNELNRAMGKTDIAALDMPFADIVELVRNKAQTAREIKTREDAIRTEAGNATVAATYLLKSKQLAKFMKTGVVGNNLYRNAPAIALKVGGVFAAPSPTMVKNIDELVTLYALRDMEQNERDAFNSLVQDEGLEFTFSYLKQQRVDETAKALQHKGSSLNHYKGYIPSVQSSGMSLIVADDTQDARLKAMSYVRVGDYNGAGAEGTVVKRGYYFNNAPTRGTFNQGIMQNVNMTANGVSAAHGFSQGLTAGVITDPVYVAKLFKRINAGAQKGTNEHLMPIFDELGGVIAYERSIDPVQLERLQSNNKLHQMLGVWRGRQVEEAMAHEVNNKLVDNMVGMYEKDVKAGKSDEYVNIFDPKDKILADALKLMPADVRDYMLAATGNTDEFWVRRDMVFDAFGYRTASVGDAWTGNSRWTPETQKVFQKVALGVMGNQAFSRLLSAEKFVQGYMADARTTIVVKSVIVPALNLISNLGQLIARGVPLKDVLRKAPTKTVEIEAYVRNRLRQVDAEAELRAAKTTNETLKLEAEIQSLKDAQRRLTIWPLIEAGEFTAISDVGLTHDDIDLSQGRWHQYIEKKVDKLPEAVRNAGRYAYITKDTALFQGLQKAVQYGDFLAKAIMYDDMVLRQKKTPAEAMARITEEFVNYDRLPGRFRGYLEQMGMLWFYNFKLRSSKVAISMLRNNPVHALVSNFMPVPDVLGPVGSPLEDNFLAKAVSDTLGYSIGPGMGFRAPTMNPWWQMVN